MKASILFFSVLLYSVNAASTEDVFEITDTGKCEQQKGGPLFLPNEIVSSDLASKACNALGGELAQVDSANFNNVASLLLECAGPLSRGWISSWNGINYGSSCLAMYTGSAIPGGGIDINCLGDYIRPVCISYETSKTPMKPIMMDPKMASVSIEESTASASSSGLPEVASAAAARVDLDGLPKPSEVVSHPRYKKYRLHKRNGL